MFIPFLTAGDWRSGFRLLFFSPHWQWVHANGPRGPKMIRKHIDIVFDKKHQTTIIMEKGYSTSNLTASDFILFLLYFWQLSN